MTQIRTFARATALAVCLGAAGHLFATPEAAAQSTDISGAGPVVSLSGTGGDISGGGASVTVRGVADQVRVGGASVDIRVDSTDDVSAGGGRVTIDGTIGRDLTLGAGYGRVRADVAGDARIGGIVLDINSDVAGDLYAGAADLTIRSGTSVGGDFKGGGARVSLGGDFAGKVEVGGAAVTFSGDSAGSVTIYGEDITITGLARIAGDLTVYSRNEPTIADGAVIDGEIQRLMPDMEWDDDIPAWLFPFAIAAYVAAATVVTGFVMLLFGGRLLPATADTLRRGPVWSLIVGVFAAVVVPIIAFVLMGTGIGLPVGFAVLLLLPIALIMGYATAATGIVSGILMRPADSFGAIRAFFFLLIGAVVIGLVGLIPWFGPWLVLIACITGFGAFWRTVMRRLRRREPEPESLEPPPAEQVSEFHQVPPSKTVSSVDTTEVSQESSPPPPENQGGENGEGGQKPA